MKTRLDIINNMLAVNGEAPVSSAESTNPAAIQASNTLTRVDLNIQDRGWWFNTEIMTLLFAVSTGHVILPANTLAVEPVDIASPYVQRGLKLYDTKNNTFVINANVKVKIRSQLDISEIPHAIASYLDHEATLIHYINDDGDAGKARSLQDQRDISHAYAQRENLNKLNINIRNGDMGRRIAIATHTGGTVGGTKFATGDFDG